MDILVICLVSLAVSGLTLFSGFGLGTVLMPVMAVFFPIETAVAMTAVVHLANNAFKLLLFGRQADYRVVLRFGIPAFFASLAGAWLLIHVAGLPSLFRYELFGADFEVSPIKLLIGLLILFFACLEIRSKGSGYRFAPSWLPVGGAVSGFFGGLSGNQGAFRSAFLLGAGLSKEAFVATGVVLACVVDISRLSIYGGVAGSRLISDNLPLLAAATASAFAGSFAGSRLLKKVTLTTVRLLVSVLLLMLGAALSLGLI
ncbi:MAG: sulfite exporter TauE/SafE family protein [Pseudodesulfovibrio sp.]|uniref:Probable membrane transporter protein n=1 Tax=Pseudodesulfovibrio aespoeensis (strain ATCC 700646 / DSM 10631 / Aspo-2) TaxID=643562 RepID=E6VVK8_PSEA9|nr:MULTISPECIES: sulfite exporter TauE/SafE family protein [Pseudodesulfovibrio]MBU4191228.1 sulfite exporter TauE/SafE family protein [Pseudomonadota bacterium]ADU63566.1 protein of unknown function DUF81 [Pseudodesulfovibrio aespoeensis Aspo-2]MBU4242804.1 sulfite exporter TauE/SafE family protein [Pseudomonadota bacterium]MBU4377769.1 sulfite exporter TauE/SafE family protein [Pseudomonadota bacterium]MBU4475325.1 sulfite exporter TauE/SafE family protein [Pseudomonadota bacterium]